jgi:hypothetical protein
MNKFYLLLFSFLVIGCKEEVGSSQTQNNDIPLQISEPAFNCVDFKDDLKELSKEITLVQNLRLVSKEEKEAIDYYQNKYNTSSLVNLGRLFEGKEPVTNDQSAGTTSNYILGQKIPGKIQGICVAEAFLGDGSNENVIFTVSEVDGSNFIAMQNTNKLKDAIVLYDTSKHLEVEEQNTDKNITEKNNDNTEEKTPPRASLSENAVLEKKSEPIAVTEMKVESSSDSNSSLEQSKDATKPSFNCAKAQTKVEHMICDNPKLADLDVSVARAYRQETEPGRDASYIESTKKDQKEWLKLRNTCETVECLEQKLLSRYESLAPWDFEQHE